MKRNIFFYTCLSLLCLAGCAPGEEKLEDLITDRLDRSVKQCSLMAESLMNQPDRLPRTYDAGGKLQTTRSGGWVSGFLPENSMHTIFKHFKYFILC